jgi:pimeloyl-ACP methyl ester carboxylesterase
MADIVLVPGSYHGGWYFDALVAGLRALGHRVFAPTLSGLDATGAGHSWIDLDTHVDDVLSLIATERARDVVLVGHSYGGMVITGVAARGIASLSSLIYLDAMLPESGGALWDVISDDLRTAILAAAPDGLSTAPPADLVAVDARVLPHPLRTYRQPVHYDESSFPARKTYVLSAGNPGSPFHAMHDRVAALPGWSVVSVPYGHDLMREAPEAMTDLLAGLVAAPEVAR